MKIGIFCQYNDPFAPVADITIPVLREYANRHGYDLQVDVNRPITRSIIWDRYEILAQNLEKYDWVVHMDADALVTNLNIRLEEFMDEADVYQQGIIISKAYDEKGRHNLNDGVAMFRKCDQVWGILDDTFRAWECSAIQCGQDYLQLCYETNDRPIFHIERHKAINAFLYSEYGMPETTIGNWTPGDFVLHLPGRTNERRVELFNRILPQIIR